MQRKDKIEDVDEKCEFISGDFTRRLNFQDDYFDIISSFQSLHIVPSQKQIQVFQEIDRILKKGGKIVFFEPSKYMGWDINYVKNQFKNLGYIINIFQLIANYFIMYFNFILRIYNSVL